MKIFVHMSRLFALAVLPFLMALTSCVHQWPEKAEAGFVLTLAFPGEMPQGPTHDIATRASLDSEDYDVRYVIEAYEKQGDGTYNENQAYARFEFSQDDVKKLRRVNGNASANSVHMFGTTFDISYKRFFKVEDPDGRPMQDVRADTLKLVLSEVLRDLKKKDMCYVKYELKQACFHITAR